jgi:hypothetical protein
VSAPRAGSVRVLVGGIVLVLAGTACWALYGLQAGREHRAYAHGGPPPAYVQLTEGHTYWLSVPGGVRHLDEVGVQVSSLQCTAAEPGQTPGALSVTPQTKGTKATDEIASFFSGVTGNLHIECAGVGTVFVSGGAADGFDWAGLWLILASVLLVIGIPLTLSGRRLLPDRPPRARHDYDDDFAPSALFGSDD